jgi:hypothetical protein
VVKACQGGNDHEVVLANDPGSLPCVDPSIQARLIQLVASDHLLASELRGVYCWQFQSDAAGHRSLQAFD